MSVSFSGELSYELHIAHEALLGAYRLLKAAGAAFDMVHFGLYATESMRLEKGFRHWKADLITEFNPFEAGLARFVRMDKDYVGKNALVAMQQRPPRRAFVTLALDSRLAPAHPGDSMMLDGRVVGTVSSAAWGHRVNRNLAMGYIEPALSAPGTQLAVDVLGQLVPALVIDEVQYDPNFSRVRG
jgi:dimethylglycine dehydrogenase